MHRGALDFTKLGEEVHEGCLVHLHGEASDKEGAVPGQTVLAGVRLQVEVAQTVGQPVHIHT